MKLSYIGYSPKIDLFVDLISDNYKTDDSFKNITGEQFFDKVYAYLKGSIDENDLLKFLEKNYFTIFNLQELLYKLDKILCEDILYKKKLNYFISKNIIEVNTNIFIMCVSLLFDDFKDIYKQRILYTDNSYIPLLGLFFSLEQVEFMDFISSVLNDSIVDLDYFIFIILFIQTMIDFDNIAEYLNVFLEHRLNYIDLNQYNHDKINIYIYEVFRIDKIFTSVWDEYRDEILDNSNTVVGILDLFISYHEEKLFTNLKNEDLDDNYKIINSWEIIYILLNNLSRFENIDLDYTVILKIYNNIILDNSLKNILPNDLWFKINNTIIYLIKPVYNNMNLYNFTNLERITITYIVGKDYLNYLNDVIKYEILDYQCMDQLLRFVMNESDVRRKSLFINTMNLIYPYFDVLENDKIYSIINQIIWILNLIIKENNKISDVSIILKNVLRYLSLSTKNSYLLIKNIYTKLYGDVNFDLKFEGKSFYHKLSKSNNVYYERIDREYLYAKNICLKYGKKILDEKRTLTRYINEYFLSNKKNRRENRNKYYVYLINCNYFDLYKFDLKIDIPNINADDLKSEIEFLIYNSNEHDGFKLGIILSLNLDDNTYIELYRSIFRKLVWGDIFYEVYLRYSDKFANYENFTNHESYLFVIKFKIRQKYRTSIFASIFNRNNLLKQDILDTFTNFNGNLNSYVFIYSIIFSDHIADKSKSVDMLTLDLKTILTILVNDKKSEVINDMYIYLKLKHYVSLYSQKIISYTQLQTLDEIRVFINKRFDWCDMNYSNIYIKEIEDDTSSHYDDIRLRYLNIISDIHKFFMSTRADDYYSNIFTSHNIELIIELLNNENDFYNDDMTLFYKYIRYNKYIYLENIYIRSLKNHNIAAVFIKILPYYPKTLYLTIKDPIKFNLYNKMLEIY